MKLREFVTKVCEELSQAGELPAGSLVVQFDVGIDCPIPDGDIRVEGRSVHRLRFSIPIKQEPQSNQ